MTRTIVCRTCGAIFELSDGPGRKPHFCSPECQAPAKAAYNRDWNARNRWRYQPPKSLLTLMWRGKPR
jgi:hypothetical protein